MKKLLLLILILVGATELRSQKEPRAIDSLKKRLLSPKNDSDRSFILDGIAKEYFDSNLDSAIAYGKRSLEVAKKIKLVEYQVDALNSIGVATRKKGDYAGANKYHFEALKLAQDHKLHSFYFQNVYSALCLVYTEQGNFTAAIAYSYKALHEAERQKDTLNQAITNNNLADIYFNIKQYNKAMLHYKKALACAVWIKNVYGQGLLAGNIGSVYYVMGKLDSAKLFFEKALDIAKKTEDVFGIGHNLQNLGNYYEKKGNIQEALSCFERSEKIFRENGLEPELSTAYFNLATCYLDLKDHKKAKEYSERSLAIANKMNSDPHRQSAHESLKNVYEKMGDIKMAYHHYQLYIAARDSIFNQENRKAQFKTELQYEYAKKRDADSLTQVVNQRIQDERLHQEQLRTETQKKFTYAAMAGCVLLLALVLFVFKSYKDKQKANRVITEQKREVEWQKEVIEEKQKEILDSIHYAKRIQQSLMSSEHYIQKELKRLLKNKGLHG